MRTRRAGRTGQKAEGGQLNADEEGREDQARKAEGGRRRKAERGQLDADEEGRGRWGRGCGLDADEEGRGRTPACGRGK